MGRGEQEVCGTGRRVVKETSEKVTFPCRTEGSEEDSHTNIWKKSLLGGEKSECKGPEAHLRSQHSWGK